MENTTITLIKNDTQRLGISTRQGVREAYVKDLHAKYGPEIVLPEVIKGAN